MEVDRKKFEGVIRKLIATPPLPKDVLSRKIARTAQAKKQKLQDRLKSGQ